MGKIATYVRVSTEEQSWKRQVEKTTEYVRRNWNYDPDDPGEGWEVYRDKSTGTNTARDGYKQMLLDVESGDIEAVVVTSVSRIARSIRDLDTTAERIADAGAELHIISEGLVMRPEDEDPYQRALFQLLGVFAELEANMAQMRTREGIAAKMNNPEYHHGPAPIGFNKEDGHLYEADNYDKVCTVLSLVSKDEMSKRAAAKELECGRSTIRRALDDRADLYGI